MARAFAVCERPRKQATLRCAPAPWSHDAPKRAPGKATGVAAGGGSGGGGAHHNKAGGACAEAQCLLALLVSKHPLVLAPLPSARRTAQSVAHDELGTKHTLWDRHAPWLQGHARAAPTAAGACSAICGEACCPVRGSAHPGGNRQMAPSRGTARARSHGSWRTRARGAHSARLWVSPRLGHKEDGCQPVGALLLPIQNREEEARVLPGPQRSARGLPSHAGRQAAPRHQRAEAVAARAQQSPSLQGRSAGGAAGVGGGHSCGHVGSLRPRRRGRFKDSAARPSFRQEEHRARPAQLRCPTGHSSSSTALRRRASFLSRRGSRALAARAGPAYQIESDMRRATPARACWRLMPRSAIACGA